MWVLCMFFFTLLISNLIETTSKIFSTSLFLSRTVWVCGLCLHVLTLHCTFFFLVYAFSSFLPFLFFVLFEFMIWLISLKMYFFIFCILKFKIGLPTSTIFISCLCVCFFFLSLFPILKAIVLFVVLSVPPNRRVFSCFDRSQSFSNCMSW